MAIIYVSSTYEDLKDYRKAVYRTLAKLKHDVKAMEDYVASDQRPLLKCLEDVSDCDVYVGIFAWRYGYIPTKDNPTRKSITELEYREACRLGKERLVFLLSEDAPWPKSLMDDGDAAKALKELRDELSTNLLVEFFKTPEGLALAVSTSLNLALATKQPTKLMLRANLADIEEPIQVNTSAVSEIQAQITSAIEKAENSQLLELSIGDGTSWWSTRLYLMAALAVDFTNIRQFVFVKENRKFVGMAPPWVISRAFAAAQHELSSYYSREGEFYLSRGNQAILTAQNFLSKFKDLAEEEEFKEWVTGDKLQTLLGQDLSKNSYVTVQSRNYRRTPLLMFQIIDRPDDFVSIVLEEGELLGIVDRTKLAVSIAKGELQSRLEKEQE